jgi:hypothetical protein
MESEAFNGGRPGTVLRRALRFTVSTPGRDRVHYVTEDDVRVLLGRLPAEVWNRLHSVHFSDQGQGGRRLGYATRKHRHCGIALHREIALCALPPRVSLEGFLARGQTPGTFGARWGAPWSTLAIRRFLLYDVFLHELGHLQVVDPGKTTIRLEETRAQAFAIAWCKRLWSEPFDHPDPVHNPPGEAELSNVSIMDRVTAQPMGRALPRR